MLSPVDASFSVIKILLEVRIFLERQGLQGSEVFPKGLTLRPLRLSVHLAVLQTVSIWAGANPGESLIFISGDGYSPVGAFCDSAFLLPRLL